MGWTCGRQAARWSRSALQTHPPRCPSRSCAPPPPPPDSVAPPRGPAASSCPFRPLTRRATHPGPPQERVLEGTRVPPTAQDPSRRCHSEASTRLRGQLPVCPGLPPARPGTCHTQIQLLQKEYGSTLTGGGSKLTERAQARSASTIKTLPRWAHPPACSRAVGRNRRTKSGTSQLVGCRPGQDITRESESNRRQIPDQRSCRIRTRDPDQRSGPKIRPFPGT